MNRSKLVACALLAVGLLTMPRAGLAQLTCTAQGSGAANCALGNANNSALNIAIPTVARVTVPSSTVALPAPTEVSYNTGFGSPGSIAFEMRSNGNWTLVIRSTPTNWTASPGSARQNKPRSDLQWSLSSGSGYVNMSNVNVTLASGAATNSTFQTLYLRSKYNWTLDRPGTYSLAVQIILTAP